MAWLPRLHDLFARAFSRQCKQDQKAGESHNHNDRDEQQPRAGAWAPGRFGLAVMHSPDTAPEAVACGYDLVVAGHTHGGQVLMPLIWALVTNSDLPRRLVSGAIRFGDAIVHFSPGLGTIKYAPFRFLCRPEATLLELSRRIAADGDPPRTAQPQ